MKPGELILPFAFVKGDVGQEVETTTGRLRKVARMRSNLSPSIGVKFLRQTSSTCKYNEQLSSSLKAELKETPDRAQYLSAQNNGKVRI